MEFLAHVVERERVWQRHLLEDHLAGVSALAAFFVKEIGEDWARLAGLWHDLGKYAPQFQSMIRRESGYDPEEQIVVGPRNHSTAGALHAVDQLGNVGRVLSYLIAGHIVFVDGPWDWSSLKGLGSREYHGIPRRLPRRHP